MAARFSGLHISLPGLGTIVLRPPTSTSSLPPLHQVIHLSEISSCRIQTLSS